jgi:cytochrome c oxidase subunit 1
MPRWMASYSPSDGFTIPSLISTIGAGIIGVSVCVLILNIYESARAKVPAGPNPWPGHTLEWATSSPPPRFNFNPTFPVPRVHSYAPLLDARERAEARGKTAGPGQAGPAAEGAEPPAAEAAGPGPAPEYGGGEA